MNDRERYNSSKNRRDLRTNEQEKGRRQPNHRSTAAERGPTT